MGGVAPFLMAFIPVHHAAGHRRRIGRRAGLTPTDVMPASPPGRSAAGCRRRHQEHRVAAGRLRARSAVAVGARMLHGPGALPRTGPCVDNIDDRIAGEAEEMRRIAAGDSVVFARLAARETPRLLRFARGLLGSLEEAEDVVQDTLVRLWERAGDWTPEARIGTWLHRVCYNRSIDRLRRRRDFVDDDRVLLSVVDDTEPPDAALVREEAEMSLGAAIDRLPARQRTAVLLFHVQDLSQREAAEVMEVSEAAFESMLARARRQLRRWLSEADHD
jgi:RNA polymerase sigma-70 factor (ECF subfamily)